MKPGDLIAIKSSFVQRYHVPFENGDKPVSCMRIKAVGTITERLDDGKTVRVEWDELDEPRDWYFYTYRTTLVEADREDAHARRLILFAFGGAKQDYDFWLRQPYWARRYSSDTADAGADITVEDETAELEGDEAEHPHYGVDNIIEDGCFFPRAFLKSALHRLRAKKNLILQGPPGTGKTWLARRLAYALIGSQHRAVAKARMRIVQFHPSLSYEDFVRGWRPQKGGGLALVDGIFLEAIQAAGAEPDRQFVLIIEEINRGNPAQIFGELLTLLEDNKRRPEEAIELAYRREEGERVSIPPNLHVIGTMNIADHSLALVDLALRRRFVFVSLDPQLGDAWRRWRTENCGFDAETVATIEERLTALNQDISEDRSLGSQYRIGHSYVTPLDGAPSADGGSWFREVVESEIGPLLEEYWYDAPDKAEQARKRLLTGLPE
jgi:5-methylcytosine-specific restriction protein B